MADITTERARKTRSTQIRRGISWNAVNLVANKGMAILVRLLLARLLVPEHFGLIAMIVVVLGLIKIFVDFGLQNALVQRKRDENSLIRYDSAFWFLLGGGIGWTLLFIIAGIPLMIWFYDESQLRGLALVMSVSILLHSLSILPTVRLTRRMRFKSQVIAEVVATVVASIMAIGMAFAGAGVWALAAQQLSTVGLKTAMLWRAAKWRPRWRYSWVSLHDVVGFSGTMLAITILDYVRLHLDKFLIAAFLSPAALGLYVMAYTLTETFRASLAGVLTKVMFPAFAKAQNNLPEIKATFLTTTRRLSIIVAGVVMVIMLYAEPILSFVLSEAWDGIVPLVQILSLAGLCYAFGGPTAEALKGIGKPKTYLKISLTNIVFIVAPLTTMLTYMFGAIGASVAAVLGMATLKARTLRFLSRECDLTLRDYMNSILPAVLVAVASLAIRVLFIGHFSYISLIVLSLVVSVTIFLFSERRGAFGLQAKSKEIG